MKPFEINRNSWHYRLNQAVTNKGPYSWERDHHNFCAYWRATVFSVIVTAAVLGMFGTLIGMFAYVIWLEPIISLSIFGGIIAFIAGIIGVSIVISLATKKLSDISSKEPTTLVGQKYAAYKQKICPSVEFKND